MKGISRLLELWEQLPERPRRLLVELAESLADQPSNRVTVFVRGQKPSGSKSDEKQCPGCGALVTSLEHQYCVECGCMLPTWKKLEQ